MKIKFNYSQLEGEAKLRAFRNYKKEVRFSIKARSVKEIDRIVENLIIENNIQYDIQGNIIK